MSGAYDPVPPDVREAYEALRIAAEAADLLLVGLSLHTDQILEAGTDLAIEGQNRLTRYWPDAGSGGLTVIGRSPDPRADCGCPSSPRVWTGETCGPHCVLPARRAWAAGARDELAGRAGPADLLVEGDGLGAATLPAALIFPIAKSQ